MPDALEFPRTRSAIVPEVFADFAFVDEFVAFAHREALRACGWAAAGRFPRLSAVAGTLDDLAEPAVGLRRIDAVYVRGRAFHVVDFPSAEMRAADVPFLALAIRGQYERALFRAHQQSHFTHTVLLPSFATRGCFLKLCVPLRTDNNQSLEYLLQLVNGVNEMFWYRLQPLPVTDFFSFEISHEEGK